MGVFASNLFPGVFRWELAFSAPKADSLVSRILKLRSQGPLGRVELGVREVPEGSSREALAVFRSLPNIIFAHYNTVDWADFREDKNINPAPDFRSIFGPPGPTAGPR